MKHNDFPGNPNSKSMQALRAPETIPEPIVPRSKARAAMLAGLDSTAEVAPLPAPASAQDHRVGDWINGERYLQEVSVTSIVKSRYQPRLGFDEKAIEELATSIQTIGLGKPILVRPLPDGKLELIGGERRWRAVQLNGSETILALVQDMSDSFAMVLALTDNGGEELTDYEYARQYQLILDEGKEKSLRGLARRVGINVSTVSRCMALMQLPRPALAVMDKHPKLITSNYAPKFVEFAKTNPEIVERVVAAMADTGLQQEAALRLIEKEIAALNKLPDPRKSESRAVKGVGTIKVSGTRLELKCVKGIDAQRLGQCFEEFLKSLDLDAVRSK